NSNRRAGREKLVFMASSSATQSEVGIRRCDFEGTHSTRMWPSRPVPRRESLCFSFVSEKWLDCREHLWQNRFFTAQKRFCTDTKSGLRLDDCQQEIYIPAVSSPACCKSFAKYPPRGVWMTRMNGKGAGPRKGKRAAHHAELSP